MAAAHGNKINNFFTISNEQPSSLTKIKFYENIHLDKLKKLLKSDLLKTETWTRDDWGFSIDIENERVQMEKLLAKMNKRRTQYKKNHTNYIQNKSNIGRVYVSDSLGFITIRNEIRHTLADNKYYDIDVKNCHPSVLNQYAKFYNLNLTYLENYVNNREELIEEVIHFYGEDKVSRKEVKDLFIGICYTSAIETWENEHNLDRNGKALPFFLTSFKKDIGTLKEYIWKQYKDFRSIADGKKNPKGSFMSYITQEFECKLLEHMFNYLVEKKCLNSNRNGQFDGSLCFDGIMVPKDNVKIPIDKVLDGLNAYIYDKTGLDIIFTEKTMNEGYTDEDIQASIDAIANQEFDVFGKSFPHSYLYDGVCNDLEAAEKVINLYPHWKYDTSIQKLFVFDPDTGMWSDSISSHIDVVSKLKLYLRKKNDNGDISKTKGYGDTGTLINSLWQYIKANGRVKDDGWLDEKQISSEFYLLFKNGYYDMKNNTFFDKATYGFNPDIVFYGRIPRDYKPIDTEMTELIESLKEKLFYRVLGEDQGNSVMQYLACALAGYNKIKKVAFGIGPQNSGKGTISKVFNYAFGKDYCGSMNLGVICKKSNSSQEDAQKLRWALKLKNARCVFSNEGSDSSIDGEVLKKLSSGGETLIGRDHGKTETSFVNQFLMFCNVNSFPELSNKTDSATNSRLIFYEFKKSFMPTDKITDPDTELPEDETFYNSLSTNEVKDAFVNLLIQKFYDVVQNDMKMYIPPECEKNKKENLGDKTSLIDYILEDFDITGNSDDWVSNTEIGQWLGTKNDLTGKKPRDFNSAIKKFLKNPSADIGNIDVTKVFQKIKKITGITNRCWIGIRERNGIDNESCPDNETYQI